MLNKFIHLSFTACVLCTTLVAQGPVAPTAKAPAAAPPSAQTKTTLPYIETVGVVFENALVSIRPEIGGIVTKMYVQEGQDVKKGDLLFELEAHQSIVALEQAKATQQRNLALLNLARSTLERNTGPAQNNAITKLAFEQFQTNVKTAEATSKGDKIAVKNAELNLARTRITAPISGRLGVFAYGPGSKVMVGDPKNILTDLRQISPAEIRIQLSLSEFDRVNKNSPLEGIKVEVSLMTDKNQPFDQKHAVTGHLYAMDNHFDPQTGKIMVKAIIPNEKKGLWPGENVRVRIYADTKNSAGK